MVSEDGGCPSKPLLSSPQKGVPTLLRLLLASAFLVLALACAAPTPPPPTATPIPTPAPTPTPLPDIFEMVPRERIVTVAGLDSDSPFWEDSRPILLLGCHTDTRLEAGEVAFFDPETEQNLFIPGAVVTGAAVRGYFGQHPGTLMGCRAMMVSYRGKEAYCFYRQVGPPVDTTFHCPGWEKQMLRFEMAGTGGNWQRPIAQTVLHDYE